MLDRSGLKKYSNPSWFKQNLMARSGVAAISWLGSGEQRIAHLGGGGRKTPTRGVAWLAILLTSTRGVPPAWRRRCVRSDVPRVSWGGPRGP